jgi:hypothetical protein
VEGRAVSAQADLVIALERGARVTRARRADPQLDALCARLAHWQSRRLAMTYADLAASPRYTAAVTFFQSDLYGAADYSQRDADLSRVVPVMVRLLPGAVIATVAEAMELSALSHELDEALALRLGNDPLDARHYARAYRDCDNLAARKRQIALVMDVGQALDRYVRKPLLRASLSAMRRPARAAGLGELQGFLERGFDAFARMRGADEFMSTIVERELALMHALFASEDSALTRLVDSAGSAQA